MAKRSVARPAQKLHRPPFKLRGHESIFLEFILTGFRAMPEETQDRALALAASLYENLKGSERGTMPEKEIPPDRETSLYLGPSQLEQLENCAGAFEGIASALGNDAQLSGISNALSIIDDAMTDILEEIRTQHVKDLCGGAK